MSRIKRKSQPKYHQPGGRKRSVKRAKRVAASKPEPAPTKPLAKSYTHDLDGARAMFREHQVLTLEHVQCLLERIDQFTPECLGTGPDQLTDKMRDLLAPN